MLLSVGSHFVIRAGPAAEEEEEEERLLQRLAETDPM